MSYFYRSVYSWRDSSFSFGTIVNWQQGSSALELPQNCHSIVCSVESAGSQRPIVIGFSETSAAFQSSFPSPYGFIMTNKSQITIPLGTSNQTTGSRVFWVWNSNTVGNAIVSFMFLFSNGDLERNSDYDIGFPLNYS